MPDSFQLVCTLTPHQQNVINRAAWKLAANNLVALNDTINVIAYLRQIAATGMAAQYDNAYVVRVLVPHTS